MLSKLRINNNLFQLPKLVFNKLKLSKLFKYPPLRDEYITLFLNRSLSWSFIVIIYNTYIV